MMEEWKPKPLDLALSVAIATVFPFIAQLLYLLYGALIPMLIYYGLAWGMNKWRRDSTGYFNEFKNKPPMSFFLNLSIVLTGLTLAFFAPIVNPEFNLIGVLLTAFFWASVNAASEQLLWIYLFESWDLYHSWKDEDKTKNWFYRIIGLILFTTFIGLIHVLFWVQFLHVVNSSSIIGIIFVLLTSISGYMHIWVWRQSNQMIFTFIPHFFLNLIPLFWTGYSIIPYLLT
ncbi:MAG: hypothetical protein ACTSR8_06915 [Promethearchaeota archaeon]